MVTPVLFISSVYKFCPQDLYVGPVVHGSFHSLDFVDRSFHDSIAVVRQACLLNGILVSSDILCELRDFLDMAFPRLPDSFRDIRRSALSVEHPSEADAGLHDLVREGMRPGCLLQPS